MNRQTETLVTITTPAGRGAVAVVVVRGPRAVAIVDACFLAANGRALDQQPAERISFGRWLAADGEEVVVCRRGDDAVEVHCHGGHAAVRAALDSLTSQGAREGDAADSLAEPGECLLRQQARVALAKATTSRTALILLDQFNGSLPRAIEACLAKLNAGESVAADLQTLLDRWQVGRRLVEPARIVLTGPPNVGKSSLVNALVGYERAIVFDAPGTTRDAIDVASAVDGWPVRFVDTAGLRESEDPLEQAGVAIARSSLQRAAIVVHVDEAADLLQQETQTEANSPAGVPTLRVANKMDQLSEADREQVTHWSDVTPTCAITGEGIGTLLEQLSLLLCPNIPPAGTAIPFDQSQVAGLESALDALNANQLDEAKHALQALLSPI